VSRWSARKAAAEAEAERRQRCAAVRQAAAQLWEESDPQTRQRTAMVIAAFLLDAVHEHRLADWLLCARPEHARAVATGVAVHALRRGYAAPWDALAAVGAMDQPQADDWFYADDDFCWSPDDGMLAAMEDAA
jgi:hypothetical protein